MQEFGNRKAAMIWEATLPDGFRRPSANDGYALEKFIRAKYVSKQFYKNRTREELDAAPVRSPKVEPQPVASQPQVTVEDTNTRGLSNPTTRRPIRKTAGYTFTPPSSPPPQSPPATDFGPFVKNPLPPVDILSTAVNLLSLESHTDSEFGAFTPPAVPHAATPSVASPAPVQLQQVASPEQQQQANQQAAKDSIMGLFEPAANSTPLSTAYGFYQTSMSPAGYLSPVGSPVIPHHQPQAQQQQQQQVLYQQPYHYASSSSGYSSPAQYYQQPISVATQQYYQQPGYMSPTQQPQPQQQQWGGGYAVNHDPIMQQIQSMKQNNSGTQSPGSGLASLMF